MFKDAMEWTCNQINDNFRFTTDVDGYLIGLGGEALDFTRSVWDVSMILASVVFAIIACFELYSLTVRTEARGGPMGSAEVVFKVMFKVAVCFIALQVSFDILINVYHSSNALTEAIGSIRYNTSFDGDLIDVDAVVDETDSFGLGGSAPFLIALLVLILSWGAKIAAVVMILMRMIQVYLYLAISPLPLATLPSQEFSQIGKQFLKSFVAVCIQGTLIYLVVRYLPALMMTVLDSNLMTVALGAEALVDGEWSLVGSLTVAALYSVGIITTLAGTQSLSRRICGAM